MNKIIRKGKNNFEKENYLLEKNRAVAIMKGLLSKGMGTKRKSEIYKVNNLRLLKENIKA